MNKRVEWYNALAIIIPISLQSLLYSSASIIDQIMLGGINEIALVSVNIAGRILDIFNYFLIAISGGVSIIAAQYYGGKEMEKIGTIVKLAKKICFTVSAFVLAIAYLIPKEIMRVFTSDEQVKCLGALYFSVTAIICVPAIFTSIYSALLRNIGIAKSPFYISIFSVFLNLGINYILIYGKFGFPEMGVIGAAIGTIISKFFEMLLIIVISWKNGLIKYNFNIKQSGLNIYEKKKFLIIIAPLLATNLSFVFANTFYTAIYSNTGVKSMAAFSMVVPMQSIIISFFSGASTATTILVGKELGASNYQKAYDKAKSIIKAALIFSIMICLICGIISERYLQIFKMENEIYQIGKDLLLVILAFIPIKVVNMILVQGVLSSGGETKFLFKLSLVGMWLIGVPMGLLGSVMNMPICYIYIGITIEELIRVVVGLYKMRNRTWMRNLCNNIQEEKIMKASIVVINKDRDFSIGKCIEAIVNQMNEGDELIVVDDGSTDDSVKIIEDYKDDITLFETIDSNGNRGAVRNYGAKYAKNEIIIFVDSDVIMGSNNLMLVKKIHEDDLVVGTNGNVFGNGHDIKQFEFLTHKEFKEFMGEFSEDFSVLFKYKDFFDGRYNYPEWTSDRKGNWTNYFTSFASVTKHAFCQIGGFDENFKGWGAEDVEFAYRLNKVGDIVYSDDILSFHYPHAKNLYLNTINNIENVYYILNKYKSFDMEVFVTFTTITKQKSKAELRRLYTYICKYNMIRELELKDKELAIYFSDKEHKDGLIEYVLDNKKGELALFGFSIPFSDNEFNTVYITKAYSLIPEALVCIIFQEALRISKKVLIERNFINQSIFNNNKTILNINPFYNNVCYISQQIADFDICEYDHDYYEIKWKESAKIFLQKQITRL